MDENIHDCGAKAEIPAGTNKSVMAIRRRAIPAWQRIRMALLN
jgi:hypothetical protein